MKLLRRLTNFPDFAKGAVTTIGNFDGVHLGHQALLRTLKAEACRLQLPLVLFLFEPQPAEFFRPDEAPARLTSLREKLEMLKFCEVDYVFCLKFDKKLALMPAQTFAENYFFSVLKSKYLLIGEDCRFGQNRLGDVHLLQELGAKLDCKVATFPNYSIHNNRVSSTKIRNALAEGELKTASEFLGRTFSLCGRVIKGDGRGRQWGIPTANLTMHRLKLPLKGVFCVQVSLSGGILLNGVANLGSRPTVDGSKNILEIHLFDFDDDLYGKMLQVFFLHKLRDEIKFSSVDTLIAQIHDDIARARLQFREMI